MGDVTPSSEKWVTLPFMPTKMGSLQRQENSFNNFSPLCSRLRPDVRDRQTSVAHHRLMHPPYGGGGIITKHTLHVCNSEQMQSLIHKHTVQ